MTEIIGQNLRAWRKAQNPKMTQADLARLLFVSINTVGRIERGEVALSRGRVEQIRRLMEG